MSPGRSIVAIDSADDMQAVAVTDDDSRVLAAEVGMPLVCVQPLLVGRAREAKDFTRDETDDNDAVLIAWLVSELRCHVPERPDETWAHANPVHEARFPRRRVARRERDPSGRGV